MADSGTVAFDLQDSTVRLVGEIRWAKSGGSAEFFARVTQAYSYAYRASGGGYYFNGNEKEQLRLGVDGAYTAWVDAAGKISAGTSASGQGWIQNNYFPDARTESLTRAGKNTAYALTVQLTGNGGAAGEYSVTIAFALPLWVEVNGTLRPVEKVYANVNGTIRECAVYANVNGEIKEIR